MIPFFQYNSIIIGPVVVQVWGIFVALGLLSAIFLAYFLAKKYLLSGDIILDICLWVLMGGILGARIFHIIFYEPVYYLTYPIDILKIWQGGLSSLGGFAGAALALWLFAKKRRFSLVKILPYIDISALSLWLGWAIGRVGCFFIHDHPGKLTDFFLAVNFPNGARHDLGLYDSLLALVLFIVYSLLFRKLIKIHWGLVAAFSFMDYALARFFLDFLRADRSIEYGDVRYFYLTPAQWGMALLFFGLTFMLLYYKMKRRKRRGSNQ